MTASGCLKWKKRVKSTNGKRFQRRDDVMKPSEMEINCSAGNGVGEVYNSTFHNLITNFDSLRFNKSPMDDSMQPSRGFD